MTTSWDDTERRRTLVSLRRVRDRIDREHAHPLDVQALARDEGMSAGHLSRQFKAAFGESPEPTDQPDGLRDCAVRDPAGNLLRIQQRG